MMSRIIVIALLAAVSPDGFAQQGFYIGGGIGSSKVEAGPFDAGDTGFQLFGGYRFSEGALPLDSTFAIEGGYVDFGTPEENVLGENLKFDLDGIKLYAVISKSLGERWSVFGKIGALSWDGKVSHGSGSGTADGSDTAAGLGASFQTPHENLSIRGEIEGFDFLDGVWLYSVSAVYHFGGRQR